MANVKLLEAGRRARRSNNGSRPAASKVDRGSASTEARIAELAYYKAEHRGFQPGMELRDWLEAEQEVRQGRA